MFIRFTRYYLKPQFWSFGNLNVTWENFSCHTLTISTNFKSSWLHSSKNTHKVDGCAFIFHVIPLDDDGNDNDDRRTFFSKLLYTYMLFSNRKKRTWKNVKNRLTWIMYTRTCSSLQGICCVFHSRQIYQI